MRSVIHVGDALDVLRGLPDQYVRCCVTSPPYWGLRDYGIDGQLGLEKTPGDYVNKLVTIFSEVCRVLADDGTLWLNLGDSYASSGTSGHQRLDELGKRLGTGGGKKHSSGLCERAPTPPGLKIKDLVGVPWRVAFALQAAGWYLRSDIIWHKPNPMPESVKDRPTKAHEYIFLLTKSAKYFYCADAINEPRVSNNRAPLKARPDKATGPNDRSGSSQWETGLLDDSVTRNKRTVWVIASQPYSKAHFATFPPKLIEPCILAGSAIEDTVLDPFAGAGTTGLVATQLGRSFLGIELNPEYAALARKRILDNRLKLMRARRGQATL